MRKSGLQELNVLLSELERIEKSQANNLVDLMLEVSLDPKTDLAGADMRGLDLSGCDLSCADLHGANLAGANLVGANLAGADLSRANLENADLRNVDLSGANLREASLSGVRAGGAVIADANFDESSHRKTQKKLPRSVGKRGYQEAHIILIDHVRSLGAKVTITDEFLDALDQRVRQMVNVAKEKAASQGRQKVEIEDFPVGGKTKRGASTFQWPSRPKGAELGGFGFVEKRAVSETAGSVSVSEEFVAALDIEICRLVKAAERRARAEGRVKLKPGDL